MSEKANTLADIQARKKALEAEITQLKTHVGDSFGHIKTDFKTKSSPVFWVKKNPLLSVAVAVGIGFILAKGNRGDRHSLVSSRPSRSTTSLIGDELKRFVIQKITDEGKDWVEKYLESKRRQDE